MRGERLSVKATMLALSEVRLSHTTDAFGRPVPSWAQLGEGLDPPHVLHTRAP